MGEATCPLGDCDYSGAVESVEAHINGSTAGEHAGKLGRDFRDALTGMTGTGGGEGDYSSKLPDLSQKQVLLLLALAIVLLWSYRRYQAESKEKADSEEDQVQIDSEEDGLVPNIPGGERGE